MTIGPDDVVMPEKGAGEEGIVREEGRFLDGRGAVLLPAGVPTLAEAMLTGRPGEPPPDAAAYRACWLVDMGYVVKASSTIFKLDYLAVRSWLAQEHGPTTVYIFNGYDLAYGMPEGLRAFYQAMKHAGVHIRLHPMSSGPMGNRQRRVDVDLSAHAIWLASLPGVQRILLTTGDQDFVPAIVLIRRMYGKPVTLLTFETMVHMDLKRASDEWLTFESRRERFARA